MKRLRFEINIIFAVVLSLFSFTTVTFYVLKTNRVYLYKLIQYVENRIHYPNLATEHLPFSSKIKRDHYYLHLRAARSSQMPLLKSDEIIDACYEDGKLVIVTDNEGFRIQKLKYSKPYLSQDALLELTTIGRLFFNETNGEAFFTVTSLTRTVSGQKQLAKHNLNATKGVSSHSYGVSFDISYVRFNGRKGFNKTLTRKLEKILIQRQKQGKIYILREKRSHCYHVTVR
jgi:hypothetical protein